jgi:Domain of unknown function (DUF4331)
MAQTETLIMCTFSADQTIQCWAGDEYVTGDASGEKGLSSESGALKVFAGPRNDPFFFNLTGFNTAVQTVKDVAGDLDFDKNGCPALNAEQSALLVGQLQSTDDGPATDTFAGANTLALVVQVDKGLVSGGGPILGVWGSTNAAK